MRKSFFTYLFSDDKDFVLAAMIIFFVAGVLAITWEHVVVGVMCFATIKVISFLTYLSWKKSNKQINK